MPPGSDGGEQGVASAEDDDDFGMSTAVQPQRREHAPSATQASALVLPAPSAVPSPTLYTSSRRHHRTMDNDHSQSRHGLHNHNHNHNSIDRFLNHSRKTRHNVRRLLHQAMDQQGLATRAAAAAAMVERHCVNGPSDNIITTKKQTTRGLPLGEKGEEERQQQQANAAARLHYHRLQHWHRHYQDSNSHLVVPARKQLSEQAEDGSYCTHGEHEGQLSTRGVTSATTEDSSDDERPPPLEQEDGRSHRHSRGRRRRRWDRSVISTAGMDGHTDSMAMIHGNASPLAMLTTEKGVGSSRDTQEQQQKQHHYGSRRRQRPMPPMTASRSVLGGAPLTRKVKEREQKYRAGGVASASKIVTKKNRTAVRRTHMRRHSTGATLAMADVLSLLHGDECGDGPSSEQRPHLDLYFASRGAADVSSGGGRARETGITYTPAITAVDGSDARTDRGGACALSSALPGHTDATLCQHHHQFQRQRAEGRKKGSRCEIYDAGHQDVSGVCRGVYGDGRDNVHHGGGGDGEKQVCGHEDGVTGHEEDETEPGLVDSTCDCQMDCKQMTHRIHRGKGQRAPLSLPVRHRAAWTGGAAEVSRLNVEQRSARGAPLPLVTTMQPTEWHATLQHSHHRVGTNAVEAEDRSRSAMFSKTWQHGAARNQSPSSLHDLGDVHGKYSDDSSNDDGKCSEDHRPHNAEVALLGSLPAYTADRLARGVLWAECLCARSLCARFAPGMYHKIVKSASVLCTYDNVIIKDISRTFPREPLFCWPYNGRRMLWNVLRAYSVYDPDIGYSQGMAFLVGILLLHIKEEQLAFWCLVQLMYGPKYNMRSFYQQGDFHVLQMCLLHVDETLHSVLPRLAQHFEREGVDASMYATQWFLTLFAYRVPVDCTGRIWDIYLDVHGRHVTTSEQRQGVTSSVHEPYARVGVIFQIAIAILTRLEATLLGLSFEDIVLKMGRLCAEAAPIVLSSVESEPFDHDALKILLLAVGHNPDVVNLAHRRHNLSPSSGTPPIVNHSGTGASVDVKSLTSSSSSFDDGSDSCAGTDESHESMTGGPSPVTKFRDYFSRMCL